MQCSAQHAGAEWQQGAGNKIIIIILLIEGLSLLIPERLLMMMMRRLVTLAEHNSKPAINNII